MFLSPPDTPSLPDTQSPLDTRSLPDTRPAASRLGFAFKGKGNFLQLCRVPRAVASPDTGSLSGLRRAGWLGLAPTVALASCWAWGGGQDPSPRSCRAGAGTAATLAQRGSGVGDGVCSHMPPPEAPHRTWGHRLPPPFSHPRLPGFTPSLPGITGLCDHRIRLCRNQPPALTQGQDWTSPGPSAYTEMNVAAYLNHCRILSQS